jgi:hypothetical protein
MDEANLPQHNQDETNPLPNNEPADIPQPQSPLLYPDDTPRSGTPKPKRHRFLMILIISMVIVYAVAAVWYKFHPATAHPGGSVATVQVANEAIPQVSCTEAKALIKQAVDGDECYAAAFKVGGEMIQYVVTEQSAAYQQKQASQCQLDCGGSMSITRSDYIVRANGKVQSALANWAEPAEPDIDELTGCGDGVFNNLRDTEGVQQFVLDHGDIGIHVSAKNLVFKDQFSDSCTISFKLTQDMSNDLTPTTGLTITQLKVHYDLQPQAACQQQSGSSVYECYQDQAVMRNDPSLCTLTIDPTEAQAGDETCIADLAERLRDPALCSTIADGGSYIQNCQTTSEQLKEVFGQKLAID